MYRARVVFNGSVNNEYPYYSIAYATEQQVRDMLHDMKPVLIHAVSVQVQESTDQTLPGVGWTTLSAFNDDWSQRGS